MSTTKETVANELVSRLTAFKKPSKDCKTPYLEIETYPSHYLTALDIRSLINVSRGYLEGVTSNMIKDVDLHDVINTLEIADKLIYAILGDLEILDELQKIKFPDLDN